MEVALPSKSTVILGASLALSVVAAVLAGASLLITIGVFDPTSSASTSTQAQMRSFILDNPEVLLEAVQRHEEAQQTAQNDEVKTALVQHKKELLSGLSPVAGNPNGDVTIVEFFDYNCPYCRKAGPILGEAIAADKGLRIVYKEWPILGPGSEFAARAALAAHVQGKYEPFHQALMTSASKVDETSTLEIASTVGLDVERLKRDMESEAIKTELQRNFALAEKLRITGTPAFVIGEEIIRGLVDLATLQQTIGNARQKSGG
jgi:protein-disulfide isomerase